MKVEDIDYQNMTKGEKKRNYSLCSRNVAMHSQGN